MPHAAHNLITEFVNYQTMQNILLVWDKLPVDSTVKTLSSKVFNAEAGIIKADRENSPNTGSESSTELTGLGWSTPTLSMYCFLPQALCWCTI